MEAQKRIEELVAKRVEEELEKRREEIEAEVLRRVEEAKKVMEEQMMQELEARKKEQLEEARRREVGQLEHLLQYIITSDAMFTHSTNLIFTTYATRHDPSNRKPKPVIICTL